MHWNAGLAESRCTACGQSGIPEHVQTGIVSMQKHKSGRNKGFGFTTFEMEEDLERTLQASTRILLFTYSMMW